MSGRNSLLSGSFNEVTIPVIMPVTINSSGRKVASGGFVTENHQQVGFFPAGYRYRATERKNKGVIIPQAFQCIIQVNKEIPVAAEESFTAKFFFNSLQGDPDFL